MVEFVEHGKLLEDNFTKDEIVKNEVLMLLWQSGIQCLLKVDNVYYEKSGELRVFKYDNLELKDSI